MTELDELPGWLAYSPRPRVEPPPPPPPGSQAAGRLQAAAEAALRGELAKLDAHPREPGTGRHTALYAAAAALGHHVAAGGIARAQVETALWASVPMLGLAQNAEAWHQVQSGLADGETEPYVLTDRPASNGHRPAPPPTPPPAAQPAHLRLRTLSELRMRTVQWAWEQRVPLGKLTVLAGLPGQGKSLLTCWLASRASLGELPGELAGQPVPVLLVSAEDDPEDTIMPRVLRTGGHPELIHVVDVREPGASGRSYTRSVSLPGDTPAILRALEVTGARLLVLDPIGGLLDADYDAHKAQRVRAALGPLKQAAEEQQAAVVLVSHLLTKAQGTDPLQRLADSHAFAGLPRSVLMFGPNPEDEQGDRGSSKVLSLVKTNLAERGEHGLAFTILEGGLVSDGGHAGYSASIRLDGPSTASAADILSSGEERTALREAIDFLRDFLADGPKRSSELRAEADSLGIAERTLKRGRAAVCGRAFRDGDGPWMVGLRGDHGPLGTLGPLSQGPETVKGAKDAKGAKGVVLSLFPDREPDSPEEKDDPEETP